VLLDIARGERDGIHVLAIICRGLPRLGVIMLSAYTKNQFALSVIRSGANAYLNKQMARCPMTRFRYCNCWHIETVSRISRSNRRCRSIRSAPIGAHIFKKRGLRNNVEPATCATTHHLLAAL
jgi:hypothetical protein